MAQQADSTMLALDVGLARVGVAIAHPVARLPRPLATLSNTPTIFDEIAGLVASENVGRIVVGLPRNLSGNDTLQTAKVVEFITQLRTHIAVPVDVQDEALTSVKAEKELRERGKPYAKGDIDALAATYILEDYLQAKGGARY